jgi:hypothetical protein
VAAEKTLNMPPVTVLQKIPCAAAEKTFTMSSVTVL